MKIESSEVLNDQLCAPTFRLFEKVEKKTVVGKYSLKLLNSYYTEYCLRCTAPLLRKKSPKFGPFIGCSTWPKCSFTCSVTAIEKGLKSDELETLKMKYAKKFIPSDGGKTGYNWHKRGK